MGASQASQYSFVEREQLIGAVTDGQEAHTDADERRVTDGQEAYTDADERRRQKYVQHVGKQGRMTCLEEHYLRLPAPIKAEKKLTNLWGLLHLSAFQAAEILVLTRILAVYDVGSDMLVTKGIDADLDPWWFRLSVSFITLPILLKWGIFYPVGTARIEKLMRSWGTMEETSSRLAKVFYMVFGWIAFAFVDVYLLLLYPWISPTDGTLGYIERLSPIVETFLEGAAQSSMQIYMWIRLQTLPGRESNKSFEDILLFSFVPSVFGLAWKTYCLKQDANANDIGLMQYVGELFKGPLGISAPFLTLLNKRQAIHYDTMGRLAQFQDSIFNGIKKGNARLEEIFFDDDNAIDIRKLGDAIHDNKVLKFVGVGASETLDRAVYFFGKLQDLRGLTVGINERAYGWDDRQEIVNFAKQATEASQGIIEFAAEQQNPCFVFHALGADIDEKDATGLAAIHWAAKKGHAAEALKRLCEGGANANVKDLEGRTPFSIAYEQQHVECAQVLEELGTEYIDADIFRAAERGDAARIPKMAGNGANVNSKDDGWRRPLHLAAMAGHHEAVRALASVGADLNAQAMTACPLHLAAEQGHHEVVKTLATSNADVNAKAAGSDRCPLHFAAEQGHHEVVKALATSNADVNAKDLTGACPLHRAAAEGHHEIVKTLATSNADVNAKDEYENSPLHLAAEKGHHEVVKTLATSKADVNTKDHSGMTPLELARNYNRGECIRVLEGLQDAVTSI